MTTESAQNSPSTLTKDSSNKADDNLIEWIKASASGDEGAFKKLYDATSPQLFAMLRRLLISDELAEEALQESFVKIWNNASEYQPQNGKARTWLTSITRNHGIDTLRKRNIRERNDLQMDPQDVGEHPGNPMPFALGHENSERLLLCLDQLSESARSCVVRSYCEGFSHEELSDQLQRPIGTIKSWIRRSLLTLKECLNGYA